MGVPHSETTIKALLPTPINSAAEIFLTRRKHLQVPRMEFSPIENRVTFLPDHSQAILGQNFQKVVQHSAEAINPKQISNQTN